VAISALGVIFLAQSLFLRVVNLALRRLLIGLFAVVKWAPVLILEFSTGHVYAAVVVIQVTIGVFWFWVTNLTDEECTRTHIQMRPMIPALVLFPVIMAVIMLLGGHAWVDTFCR
jgi:hypothetical protein